MCAYSVYKHTAPNGKIYIGITCQKPEYRWQNGLGYRTQSRFYRAIQKYGWDVFQHEIIADGLAREQAEQMEIKLIAQYKSNEREHGYNMSEGGTGGKSGCTVSDDVRIRLSEMNRGEKNPWYGKHHNEETRMKISKGNLGKSPSAEARRKISESKRGEKHYNFGKHLSEETRRKISQSNMGRCTSEETRRKISQCQEHKPVRQYTLDGKFIREYPSISNASVVTGASAGSIVNGCKGRIERPRKFIWKYVN